MLPSLATNTPGGTVPRALYVLYCAAYAREAKAVALAESEETLLAISPGALGIGILQQSSAWQADYPPSHQSMLSIIRHPFTASTVDLLYAHAMAGGPWHPAYQLACYATFCHRNAALDRLARLRLYHFGHEQAADPDGYAQRVMTFYVQLEGW